MFEHTPDFISWPGHLSVNFDGDRVKICSSSREMGMLGGQRSSRIEIIELDISNLNAGELAEHPVIVELMSNLVRLTRSQLDAIYSSSLYE